MKPNFVYAVWAGKGPIKIGKASRVKSRLSHLQIGSHQRLAVLQEWERPNGDAGIVEKIAHSLLADHRLSGEWFKVTPDRACEAVEQAVLIAEAPPPPPPEKTPPPRLSPEAEADIAWAKANPGPVAKEILRWYMEK